MENLKWHPNFTHKNLKKDFQRFSFKFLLKWKKRYKKRAKIPEDLHYKDFFQISLRKRCNNFFSTYIHIFVSYISIRQVKLVRFLATCLALGTTEVLISIWYNFKVIFEKKFSLPTFQNSLPVWDVWKCQ